MIRYVLNSSFFGTLKPALKKLGVTYKDECTGQIVGDCSTCGSGGGGEGGPTTVAVSFNPANNRVTVTVNGVSANAVVSTDTGDVTLASPITINGVSFSTGTSLHTVVTTLSGLAHPRAQLTNDNAPFSFDVATQSGNIPASPTITDNLDGTLTYARGNGASPQVIEIDLQPIQENFVDLTTGTTTITLTDPPSPRRHVIVFRNGVQHRQYSITGNILTLAPAIGMSPGGAATEDVTVLYFK